MAIIHISIRAVLNSVTLFFFNYLNYLLRNVIVINSNLIDFNLIILYFSPVSFISSVRFSSPFVICKNILLCYPGSINLRTPIMAVSSFFIGFETWLYFDGGECAYLTTS